MMAYIEEKKSMQKPPTPVMEDYLETIFDLDMEKRAVRVKDIARRLDVKMPTVTNMLKALRQRGYIDYEKYEYLGLTKRGFDIGKEIHRRHQVLRSFLTDILKIDFERADEEACMMEHAVSPLTLDRIIQFTKFLQECPRAGSDWLDNFEEYCLKGQNKNRCLARVKEFSNKFIDRVRSADQADSKNNTERDNE